MSAFVLSNTRTVVEMVFWYQNVFTVTVLRGPAGREPAKLAKLQMGLLALCVEDSTQRLSSVPVALASGLRGAPQWAELIWYQCCITF